jgi:hypothetical protein
MAYSADGITWTAVTDSTFGSSTIYSIAYGGGKFVAVGNSWLYGGIIRYSADGVTWTEVDSDSINSVFTHNFITAGTGIGDIPSIAYGGGKFVIGGLLGQMGYSADGVTWTEVADSPFDFTDFGMIRGITYGGGKFVAVGDHGQMGYSADGVTWTGIPAGTAIDGSTFGSNDRINSVAYGGTPGSEKFVAVESYSGGIAYTN